MTRFQLIFTGILVALGIAGAVIFAVSKSSSSKGAVPVVMWGTVNADIMDSFLAKINQDNKSTLNVSYVQRSPTTFESDLIAALANGQGPDMALLPQDLILKQFNKFYVVPFTTYSQRTYLDSFVQEGNLFTTSQGIIGFPFAIDPMVMYWNRQLFTSAGIANPPTTWTQFYDLVPKLTIKDQSGNITQSAVALGEAANISHFKDMLALLSFQAGTTIVAPGAQGVPKSVFDQPGSQGLVPGEEATSFFTQFADPLKSTYSWNRSMPKDRDAFIAGNLAVYFGYASELQGLRNDNPNLNFDVAIMPQASGKKVTFADMSAVAILKSSRNIPSAFTAAVALTDASIEGEWATESRLPPTRRDLLATVPGDAYGSVFYQSALISDAWLDPNSQSTTGIFSNLVNNINSGSMKVSEAVKTASQQIDALLSQDQQ